MERRMIMIGDLDRVIVERRDDGLYEAKAQIYCAGYITVRSAIGNYEGEAIKELYKRLRYDIARAKDFMDMIDCGLLREWGENYDS